MHIPSAFEETRRETLFDLIEANPFAPLVGVAGGAPVATHLPFLLDRAAGPGGTLYAHMARANPHWRAFDGTAEALAVFSGPHAYVSPRWYAPGNAVPTWNYAVVHAWGTPRIVDDLAAVRRQQEALVAAFEGPEGWRMDGQPAAYLDAMLEAIVAFEIPLARLEGKFKLSQNRPEGDRRRVADALAAGEDGNGRALAALMRTREG